MGSREGSNRNQYIAALIVTMPSLVMATVMTWPSYALPILRSESSPIEDELTVSQAAWIGSIPCIGAMFGSLLGGILMSVMGRKKLVFLSGLPLLSCWLIVLFAPTVNTIIAARFTGGFGGGIMMLVVPCFLVEFAEISIRGKILAALPLSYYLGILFSYVVGGLASYTIVNLIFVSMAVLFLVLVLLMPESPVYLIREGREKEAAAAMAWYRCAKPYATIVQQELTGIKAQFQEPVELVKMTDDEKDPTDGNAEKQNLNDSEVQQKSSEKNQSEIKLLFSSRVSRKALALGSILFILITSTGILALQTYAGVMFEKAVPTLPSHICSIFLALVMAIGCVASAGTADLAGRKILMVLSLMGIGICMASIGLILQTGWGPSWLMVALTCTCVFINSIGAGTIPFVLLGELFIPEVRGAGTTIVIEVNWLTGFFLLSAFEPLVQLLSIHSVFYIFSVISIITCVFCMTFIPETKGLSIQEIQDALAGNRRKNNHLGL